MPKMTTKNGKTAPEANSDDETKTPTLENPTAENEESDDNSEDSDASADESEHSQSGSDGNSASSDDEDKKADRLDEVQNMAKKLPPTTPQRRMLRSGKTGVSYRENDENEDGDVEMKSDVEEKTGKKPVADKESEYEDSNSESDSDDENEAKKNKSQGVKVKSELKTAVVNVSLPIKNLNELATLCNNMNHPEFYNSVVEKLKAIKAESSNRNVKYFLPSFIDDTVTADIGYASNKSDETSLKKKYPQIFKALGEAWMVGFKDTTFHKNMSLAFKDIKSRLNKTSSDGNNSSARNDSSMDISDNSKSINEIVEERPAYPIEANVTIITPGAKDAATAAVTTTPPNTIGAKPATGSKPKQYAKAAPRQPPQNRQVAVQEQLPTVPQNSPQPHSVQQKAVHQVNKSQQQANLKRVSKQMVQNKPPANKQSLPRIDTILPRRQPVQVQEDIYNKIEPYNVGNLPPQPNFMAPNNQPHQAQISLMSGFQPTSMPIPPPNVQMDINQQQSTLNELKMASRAQNNVQPFFQGANILNVQNLPIDAKYIIVNPEHAPKPVQQQKQIRRLSVQTTDPVTQRKVLKQISLPREITLTKTIKQRTPIRAASDSIPFTQQNPPVAPPRASNGLFIPEQFDQNVYNEQSVKAEVFHIELQNLKMKYNALVQQFNSMIQKEQARSNKAKEILNNFQTIQLMLKDLANQ